jgi:type IV pilus assembly protein PilB
MKDLTPSLPRLTPLRTPIRAPRWERLETVLLEAGLVGERELRAARIRRAGSRKPAAECIVDEGIDPQALIDAVAHASGAPRARPEDLEASADVQALVPANVVHRNGILPLRLEGDDLLVLTSDPFQLPVLDDLRDRTGKRVRPLLATPAEVRAAALRARPGEEALDDIVKNEVSGVEVSFKADEEPDSAEAADESRISLQEVTGDGPVVRFVNLMISDAIQQGASDIHVEPEQDSLRVRLRVDGELREVQRVPRSVRQLVTSRLKVVAGLDLIENRRPQDGRARVDAHGKTYDLRVSTLPTFFGEKVVIRLLDREARTFDLDGGGMEPGDLARWRALLQRPNGLLLVTGPTGSGKTSTLYASLLELRSPAVNIVTVEDPVEFQFPGIVQVPVRHDLGLGFAAVLRSTLRQDPDVVLVGEVRDAETAEVAMQAALTGHLVLSTAHTNDALGAIERLTNLGVPTHLLAGGLLGILAQRLVRRVCEACAERCDHDPALLRALGASPERGQGRRGRGCARCRGTGLSGRTALTELVRMTPALRELVLRGASGPALAAQARADGTRTLLEDGIRLVEAGVTLPQEVLAVAGAADVPAPARPDRERRAAPHVDGAGGRGPTRVLVCDDDPIQRRLAVAALRSTCDEVLEVSDGEACLDAVARSRPAALVIDHHMEGLTGVDVIRRLRASLDTATLPIVMLTGSGDDELEVEVLGAGADDYLTKPVVPERLRARLRAHIDAAHRASGGA